MGFENIDGFGRSIVQYMHSRNKYSKTWRL